MGATLSPRASHRRVAYDSAIIVTRVSTPGFALCDNLRNLRF